MTSTRRRRSSAEVRRLVLDAARELFAERGYAGATTREVARRAGVTEQVVFNQFESKERLYTATVLEPFEAFVREHVDSWRAVPAAELDPREMLASYIADLYHLVLEHRALFLALGEERFGSPVERILKQLDAVSRELAELHGFPFDAAVGVRTVFAATTTLALHQDSLLPTHTAEAVIEELSKLLIPGITRTEP